MSSEENIEIKKRKPSELVNFNELDQFKVYKDLILPPLEDEEIEVLDQNYKIWKIESFKAMKDSKEHKFRGPKFTVGNMEWNVLFFPNANANNNIALYLEPNPPKKVNEETGELEPVDPNWCICAQFTLVISNPNNPKNFVLSTSHQRFSKYAVDWGFSNFIDVKALNYPVKDSEGNQKGPLIFEDKLTITAFVQVLKDPTGVLWHNFMDYDSKEQTGFVGFKNQGATCYLNSLLQSYFFTKSFRKSVYKIPTNEENPEDSVSLALQKIFFQLQHSKEAIDTLELTKSFGWNTADAFEQHDVQELNRILMDRLETKMKGTPVENSLNKTFVGKMKSYIKCINVDYESSRTEDFWDIQLNVKDLKNLNESFKNYIEVEIMNGENQYMAQDFGLQDAKKGVIFEEFPNVLHLQLKRFEYDFNYDTLVKINDRYEFPDSIDLSPYLDHGDDGKANTEPCIYDLHGVLVHAGDISTGHYYAMIKPNKDNKWFRFDDDKVWRVSRKEVFDENFGMDAIDQSRLSKMTRLQYQKYQLRRHTSAYMLVYIKRSKIDDILEDVTDDDVPKYIVENVSKELEEQARKRKELEEMHLYLNVNFFTNALFKRYNGFDIGANEGLTNPLLLNKENDYPITLKLLKTDTFRSYLPKLSELTNIKKLETLEFWSLSHRKNKTLRVSHHLKNILDLTIEEIFEEHFISKKYYDVNIWIEEPELELHHLVGEELVRNNMSAQLIDLEGTNGIDRGDEEEDDELVEEIQVESKQILLFIKLFNQKEQSLNGLTHIFVNIDDPISSILSSLTKYLGIADAKSLSIYEELQPGSIESINLNSTFQSAELTNGDILTVEVQTPELLIKNNENKYPFFDDVLSYYDYLNSRILISVEPLNTAKDNNDEFLSKEVNDKLLENEEDSSFKIAISIKSSFEEFSKILGSKINVDPKFLRLFVNYNGQRYPFKTNMVLSNVILKQLPAGFIPKFEYEVLNISLHELENMKSIKIHWLTSSYIHYQTFDFLIPVSGTVQDLIDKLSNKLKLSQEDKDNLVIWATSGSKFEEMVLPEMQISRIDDDISLFVRVLPEELEILKDDYHLYNNEVEEEDEKTPVSKADERKLIPVFQFNKDPKRFHGIPFIFPLYKGEKLPETKARLHKTFGLGQKEFNRIQLCTWNSRSPPKYFHDSECNNGNVNSSDVELFDVINDNCVLCLDHPDRLSRQSGQGGGISIR